MQVKQNNTFTSPPGAIAVIWVYFLSTPWITLNLNDFISNVVICLIVNILKNIFEVLDIRVKIDEFITKTKIYISYFWYI